MEKGRLYIISAPSGAGKSTLCSMLINKYPAVRYSISYTTRAPRGNEQNGKEYFFINKAQFENMAANNDFLEWAEVHGNYYGTSKTQIEDALKQGIDIFLDIDPQGAMQLKEKLNGKATFIFIAAPSLQELKSRLEKRGTDKAENIALRLENAKKEVEYFNKYDYLIINDASDDAFKKLETVYLAEKLRTNQYNSASEFMNI
ncbi:MAG: guanylate kinase [Mucispirillum sp.]|uniref:Guanylate kinase n=1 Tax=Candidatus Mucispirillum faecigallinarum TaxID=2838699 RepID=A0A9D2KC92_9BACT|nr:guanylate kinase [Mucispirillum sp.]HIZ89602.1 guanylate kinase [Candidatus Mucispirillum faecigallinarum]